MCWSIGCVGLIVCAVTHSSHLLLPLFGSGEVGTGSIRIWEHVQKVLGGTGGGEGEPRGRGGRRAKGEQGELRGEHGWRFFERAGVKLALALALEGRDWLGGLKLTGKSTELITLIPWAITSSDGEQ